MKVGDFTTIRRQVSTDLVENFGRLIGDMNPVHFDEEFAKKTRFGKRIAHGMICAGFISSILGNYLPGPGAIYISQQLSFKRPVFLGDIIYITAEVSEWDPEKKKVTMSTICTNQDQKIVVEGEAVLLVQEV